MVKIAGTEELEEAVKLIMEYRTFYGVSGQSETEVRAFVQGRIKNNQSKIFIAYTDCGVPAGFIQLYPSYSTVSLKPQWVLNDFFVKKEFRCKGFGTQLMQSVKEYFKDKAKGFILVTDKENYTAKKFYESNGWKTGEYDFYTFYY